MDDTDDPAGLITGGVVSRLTARAIPLLLAAPNFRSFRDETFYLNPYSCLVGANDLGKSTVLTALNLFFRDQYSAGPPVRADYFEEVTARPIRVTVTFDDLSDAAQRSLSHYVRHGEVVFTLEATFNEETDKGEIAYYGTRDVIQEFVPFFEATKEKVGAPKLRAMYASLRSDFSGLTDPTKSVVVAQPVAGITAGEGAFRGELSRMGHGFRRSHLLALLDVLADSEAEDSPTLLLGCEEPELSAPSPGSASGRGARLLDDTKQPGIGHNALAVLRQRRAVREREVGPARRRWVRRDCPRLLY